MLPFMPQRARGGLYPQDLGYGVNTLMAPRRNQLGPSPLLNGNRMEFGGLGPIAGFGGGALGQLGGIGGGFGGLQLGGIGANALGLNGLSQLGLNGVGALGRGGRLPPAVGATGYANGLSGLFRGGLTPIPLANATRRLGRGNNLIAENPHYVYPPVDQHFSLPVYVQSFSGRRKLGGNSEFVLTVPHTATIDDIHAELGRGRWDLPAHAIVVNIYGESFLLEEFVDISQFYEVGAECVIVFEN